MKKISLLIVSISVLFANTTFAATGTVTFNGKLVTATCNANVGGTTLSGTDVILPTLHIGALAAENATAGTTPFTITLTDGSGSACAQSNGLIATPYFESEVAKVNSAGRLINTDDTTGSVVDVQLLNSAGTVININDSSVTQATSKGTAAGVFNYSARYYATAPAVAGNVTSSVSYSIIYK